MRGRGGVDQAYGARAGERGVLCSAAAGTCATLTVYKVNAQE
jgi:hypothetical protein